MTWPTDGVALPQGLELYAGSAGGGISARYGGALEPGWVDITEFIYSRDSVNITRGRSNEGSSSEPARMNLTLDNRDGRFSPRNPSGIYYGKLGRNTKIRYWIKNGQPRCVLFGGDQFTTPDSAPLSITGDIDLRVDIVLDSWRPFSETYIGPVKGGSYNIYLASSGCIGIEWYKTAVQNFAESTEPVPGGISGRKSVRVTLDVNNGAGGNTATFYYSSDSTMDGTWVQFGSTVVTAGTTSIDNTADTVGIYSDVRAEINEARIYSGIAGTKVASPKFTTQVNDATSFVDAEGNTWSADSSAELTNKHIRFYGEVSSWPVKWDPSGSDIYTPIECYGMTRRLGQGAPLLKSALRRGVPDIGATLVGYWPLEDAATSTVFESAMADSLAGRISGTPSLYSYTGFIASDATPAFNAGSATFTVPHYTNTDEFQVRGNMHIPPGVIPNGTVLMRISTNSSFGWADIVYQTGDGIVIKTYTNLGVLSLTTSMFDISMMTLDQDLRFSLEFVKNGTGVDITQQYMPIGNRTALYYTANNPSITLGSCTSVVINPTNVDIGEFSIGHLTVESAITTMFDSVHYMERAYRGEESGDRIKRLCSENSITSRLLGYNSTENMGPQARQDLLTLLRECEATDAGILTEARDAGELSYRTRESVYNQSSSLTLSYTGGLLSQFDPVDDDQRTRNKVTVTRNTGSSSTMEDVDSRLSTKAPPDGVGIYEESANVSLYSDLQTLHQAGWRVCLGTVDEYRYPQIQVNLAHPGFSSNQSRTRDALSVDCGDRISVSGLPSWMPPDTVDQVVLGYNEKINQFEHTITYNCSPYKPYRSGMYDGHPTTGLSRYSNRKTVINGAHDSVTTSLSVAFTSGNYWSHADGDFDIIVSGERMTVTATAGTSSPQTFTVTRSVNGVVKSHDDGEKVELFDPSYYALSSGNIGKGQFFKALDHSLPDVATAYGNGVNTITSTTFAVLPSYPVKTQVFNPHPTGSLVCLVGFGGWLSASTADLRLTVRISRAGIGYADPGIGNGGPLGYGEIPATFLSTLRSSHSTFTCELLPSIYPYIFEVYAMRASAAGTQEVRYPTIRVIPLRYKGI